MRTEPGRLEAGSAAPREPVDAVAPPSTAGGRTAVVVTAILAVLALIAATGATFAWRDTDAALTRATEARDAAYEDLATLAADVDRLEERLGTDVPRLERRLDETRDALGAARAELAALAGPALTDGRHFVRIVAVGDDQQPPRLVVDLQRWFTDQEAVDAALEDGVPRSEAGINGYYIRNDDPRWRIVEVDPGAPVALTTYPHGQVDDPGIVDLTRFGSLFGSDGEYLRYSPYWITVEDGTVQRIEEQYVP